MIQRANGNMAPNNLGGAEARHLGISRSKTSSCKRIRVAWGMMAPLREKGIFDMIGPR